MNAAARAAHDRTAQVWAVLATVPDPEVPVISLCELGIVREVLDHGRSLEVVLTPTYSGCPATELIETLVREALADAGITSVTIADPHRRPAQRTRGLPALRQRAHRAAVGFWRHRVQGAVALPGLPRALRTFQTLVSAS